MKKYKVELFRNYCKSCQLCMLVCPKAVFGVNERGQVVVQNPDVCIGCMQCYNICPDFALEVTQDGD